MAMAILWGSFTVPAQGYAAERSVKVTLPDFTVKLNGNTVANQYREYPLLVYKDITYVPMTWYDSRLLGLETRWSEDSGLTIGKGPVTSSYAAYLASDKNKNSYSAAIAASDITINGKPISNANETYPLLSFRDVTYFPLTWRFAHDEFGWGYTWDNKEGLSISSDNAHLETAQLPDYAGDNGVALFKGYNYFVETTGTTNTIYRSAEHDPANKEVVYSYEVSTSYGLNKSLSFSVRDDELWFFYHLGGATMGSNVYGKINQDGKGSIMQRGYLDFKATPYGTLIANQGVPPSGNNLYLMSEGKTDSIGAPNLIYGWHIASEGGGMGYGGSSSAVILGDDAYVMGSPYPVNGEGFEPDLSDQSEDE